MGCRSGLGRRRCLPDDLGLPDDRELPAQGHGLQVPRLSRGTVPPPDPVVRDGHPRDVRGRLADPHPDAVVWPARTGPRLPLLYAELGADRPGDRLHLCRPQWHQPAAALLVPVDPGPDLPDLAAADAAGHAADEGPAHPHPVDPRRHFHRDHGRVPGVRPARRRHQPGRHLFRHLGPRLGVLARVAVRVRAPAATAVRSVRADELDRRDRCRHRRPRHRPSRLPRAGRAVAVARRGPGRVRGDVRAAYACRSLALQPTHGLGR